MRRLRLGVNIDHVATIRNARGGRHPDPVKAALVAIEAGADGITAHLREDRRHIRDADMHALKAQISKPLNFEMAATAEMVKIALVVKPHAVCLVPEKRTELTTEGGLDVAGQMDVLRPVVAALTPSGYSGVDVYRSGGKANRRVTGHWCAGGGAAYRHLCRSMLGSSRADRDRVTAAQGGGRTRPPNWA